MIVLDDRKQLLSAILLWLVALCGLRALGLVAVVSDGVVLLATLVVLWLPLSVLLFYRARVKRGIVLQAWFSPESPWQTRLRGGVLMLLGRSVAAAVAALLLLMVVTQPMSRWFWQFLLLSIPLWLLLDTLIRRLLRRDLNASRREYVVDVVTSRAVFAALLCIWLVASLWRPQPDLSDLQLGDVLLFSADQTVAYSSWLNGIFGVWQAMYFWGVWLVQVFSPVIPQQLLLLAAWCIILLQGAAFIWPAVLLMNAALMASRRLPAARLLTSSSSAPRRYTGGVLAMLLILALPWVLQTPRPPCFSFDTCVIIQIDDTAYALPAKKADAVMTSSAQRLDRQVQGATRELNQRATDAVSAMTDGMRANVPEFVDWYYSNTGALTRGLVGIKDWFSGEQKSDAMMSRLVDGRDLEQWQRQVSAQLMGDYQEHLVAMNDQFLTDIRSTLSPFRAHPHSSVDNRNDINISIQHAEFDQLLGSEAAQMQFMSAAFIASLAPRAARASAARLSARAASRSTGRAASVGAAAPCAATATLAPVCAVSVFVATTVALEMALLKADEAMNKDELTETLINAINELEANLILAYREQTALVMQNGSHHIAGPVLQQIRPIDSFRRERIDNH